MIARIRQDNVEIYSRRQATREVDMSDEMQSTAKTVIWLVAAGRDRKGYHIDEVSKAGCLSATIDQTRSLDSHLAWISVSLKSVEPSGGYCTIGFVSVQVHDSADLSELGFSLW